MQPFTCAVCGGSIQETPSVVAFDDPDAAAIIAAEGRLIGHEPGCIEAFPFVPHEPGTCVCDPCEDYWLRAVFGPSKKPPNERALHPIPDLDDADPAPLVRTSLVDQSNKVEHTYLGGGA